MGSTMLPRPLFVSVDEDRRGITLEWCFGGQGAPDSWRVMFAWDADEGAMACKTTRGPSQESVEGDAALNALVRWLTAADDGGEGGEK